MKQKLLMMALLLCGALCASASDTYKMQYVVTPDTTGHYLNVSLTCESSTPNTIIPLKMPVWAPGYYLIVDFPKYLTDFTATDDQGNTLKWEKKGKNEWQIHSVGTKTQVSYRIYGNTRSVAECRIESHAAFIPTNGVFMYVDGHKDNGVTVKYVLPSNWHHISTGLKRQADGTYYASNFDVLYDSPALLGNQYVKHFTHEGHEYEFALETPDGFAESHFEQDFKNMVSATTKMMGHVPYDNYCLIHLGKGRGGLEHLNSQACYTDGTFRFPTEAAYKNYMTFTTHEYFHLYNVKAIRPIELGPFDYDKEVYTTLLWVSEGFTSYYENKLAVRAGFITEQDFLNNISEFIESIESKEGHKHMSLRQSSYDIWLNFFNTAANGKDVRISYYEKGPIMGLLFDIEIQRVTKGKKSLDDVMRQLYNTYYIKAQRGFTEEEFWQTVADVMGEYPTLLRKYVDTTAEIDYDTILQSAGMRLNRSTWKLENTNTRKVSAFLAK